MMLVSYLVFSLKTLLIKMNDKNKIENPVMAKIKDSKKKSGNTKIKYNFKELKQSR